MQSALLIDRPGQMAAVAPGCCWVCRSFEGGHVARGFYNSGPSQAADVAQFGKMTQGLPEARARLRDDAVADLFEKAGTSGNLISTKCQRYLRGHSEALCGVLTPAEREQVDRVATDLWRAAQAESRGMAKGSPTAQNAMAAGMLDSPGLRAEPRFLPVVNRLATLLLDLAAAGSRRENADLVARAMLDPQFAPSGLLAGPSMMPAWMQRPSAGLLAGAVPARQGLLPSQQCTSPVRPMGAAI